MCEIGILHIFLSLHSKILKCVPATIEEAPYAHGTHDFAVKFRKRMRNQNITMLNKSDKGTFFRKKKTKQKKKTTGYVGHNRKDVFRSIFVFGIGVTGFVCFGFGGVPADDLVEGTR